MLVSLLFPLLLFALVLVLYGVERRLFPGDEHQTEPGSANPGSANVDAAHVEADSSAEPGNAPAASVPAQPAEPSMPALYEEDGRRSLHHHLSLWQRIDPAIEEDYRLHSLRSVIDPQVPRSPEPRYPSRLEARRRHPTRRRRRSTTTKRRAA